MNGLALFERGPARLTQLQHVEFFGQLVQITLTHQLSPNQSPFILSSIFSNAVRRDVLMIPLADLLGIRAGQYFGNLPDAKVDAALFAQTIYAREKLLRFDGAV